MRNPRRKRDISIAALAIAVAVTAWGFISPPAQGTWLGLLMAAVLTGAFFAGCAVVMYTIGAYRQTRLLSGENVIARWRVDPKRWEAFAAYARTLERSGERLANTVKLRAPAPPQGVDIIVGKQTMQIGDEFCMLDLAMIGPVQWLEGPPPGLSFVLEYANSEGPNVRKALRFPTGANRESDARRVLEHYRRSSAHPVPAHALVGAAHNNPLLVRNISLAVMALSLAATVAGYLLLKGHGFSMVPFVAVVSGPLLLIGAAILAAITHFSGRN